MRETINENFNEVKLSNLFETDACRNKAIQISLSNDQLYYFIRDIEQFFRDEIDHFIECLQSLEMGMLKTKGDIGLDEYYIRQYFLTYHSLREFLNKIWVLWNARQEGSFEFDEKHESLYLNFNCDELLTMFKTIDAYLAPQISLDLIEASKFFIINPHQNQETVKGDLHNFFFVYENILRMELNWSLLKNTIHQKLII